MESDKKTSKVFKPKVKNGNPYNRVLSENTIPQKTILTEKNKNVLNSLRGCL